MSAHPWTVGRFVVETLAANGIDTVFGIPGVHNIELYRGLQSGRVRHVLVGAGSGALVSWRGAYDQVGWSADEISRAIGLSPGNGK